MASIKLNPVLERVRGKVGDLVFKKHGGETIIARTPDVEGRISSEGQKAVQERFRQGVLYGKMVMADPQARSAYEETAKGKGQPVFSLIVGDFLNAPQIDEVDLSHYAGQPGSEVLIRASDDFAVSHVDVAIATEAGQEVEHGPAVMSTVDKGRWTYTATAAVPEGTHVRVEVAVVDRPGHRTTKTETR